MNDLPAGSELSKLGRRLCIRCFASVTEEDVYISEDVSFPLYLFSGGRTYSFRNIVQEI